MGKDMFEPSFLERIFEKLLIAAIPATTKLTDTIEDKLGIDIIQKAIDLEEKDAKFKLEHPNLNIGKSMLKQTAIGGAKALFGVYHHK